MRNAISIAVLSSLLLLLALVPAVAQEGPDEIESNDTMDLADFIDGFIIEGEVGGKNDDGDWFVLDAQEGFHPLFILYYDDDDCDIDCDIYSDDDLIDMLLSIDSPDMLATYIPGTCYLYVYSSSGSGSYTIEIEAQVDEGESEVEPNDEEYLADEIDDLYIEGYVCQGDTDWFELDGSEGINPTFTLYYEDKYVDIDCNIYSDDELVGELMGVDSPDSDKFSVPGTCYVEVWAHEGEGAYIIEIDP